MAKIYWFTGQPGVGKDVLGKLLTDFLSTEKRNWRSKVFHIDSKYFDSSIDFSTQTEMAQTISEFIQKSGCDVVVSLVSPSLDSREKFKSKMGDSIQEFYVISNKRENADMVVTYESPKNNFFEIDNSKPNPTNSFNKIIHCLK